MEKLLVRRVENISTIIPPAIRRTLGIRKAPLMAILTDRHRIHGPETIPTGTARLRACHRLSSSRILVTNQRWARERVMTGVFPALLRRIRNLRIETRTMLLRTEWLMVVEATFTARRSIPIVAMPEGIQKRRTTILRWVLPRHIQPNKAGSSSKVHFLGHRFRIQISLPFLRMIAWRIQVQEVEEMPETAW